jgi:hypothetical protein
MLTTNFLVLCGSSIPSILHFHPDTTSSSSRSEIDGQNTHFIDNCTYRWPEVSIVLPLKCSKWNYECNSWYREGMNSYYGVFWRKILSRVLVNKFTDHLEVVTTNSYNSIADFHTKPSQSAFTSLYLVTALHNGFLCNGFTRRFLVTNSSASVARCCNWTLNVWQLTFLKWTLLHYHFARSTQKHSLYY